MSRKAGPAAALSQNQPVGMRPMARFFSRAAAGLLHTAAIRSGYVRGQCPNAFIIGDWWLLGSTDRVCLLFNYVNIDFGR